MLIQFLEGCYLCLWYSRVLTIQIIFLLQIDQLLHRQSAVEDQLRTAKKLVFIMLLAMICVLIFLIMATNNSLLLHSAAMQNANVILGQASQGEQTSHAEL